MNEAWLAVSAVAGLVVALVGVWRIVVRATRSLRDEVKEEIRILRENDLKHLEKGIGALDARMTRSEERMTESLGQVHERLTRSEERMTESLGQVHERLTRSEARMMESHAQVDERLTRSEERAVIAFGEIKAELKELRSEMHFELKNTRAESRSDLKETRTELLAAIHGLANAAELAGPPVPS